jgi:hypothetical protein
MLFFAKLVINGAELEFMQAQNISSRKRGRPKKQPVVPTSREEQKLLFLAKLVEFGTMTRAIAESGLPSSTVYKWRETGFISAEEISHCVLQHEDNIYQAGLEWALQGIPYQLDNGHGHKLFNDDGTPQIGYKRSEKIFLKFLETHPRFRGQVQAAIGISPVESMSGYANGSAHGHSVEGSIDYVGTDIAHTVLHIKLIDYTEEGCALLIHAIREAEKYRVGEQNT